MDNSPDKKSSWSINLKGISWCFKMAFSWLLLVYLRCSMVGKIGYGGEIGLHWQLLFWDWECVLNPFNMYLICKILALYKIIITYLIILRLGQWSEHFFHTMRNLHSRSGYLASRSFPAWRDSGPYFCGQCLNHLARDCSEVRAYSKRFLLKPCHFTKENSRFIGQEEA